MCMHLRYHLNSYEDKQIKAFLLAFCILKHDSSSVEIPDTDDNVYVGNRLLYAMNQCALIICIIFVEGTFTSACFITIKHVFPIFR